MPTGVCNIRKKHLKRVWHEIFSFKVFHESVFPGLLKKAISNFYENSQRHVFVSKVWSLVSMTPAINEKIFEPGHFSNFVVMLLGCCLHSYNCLLLNVHFEEVEASWYCYNCFITCVIVTGNNPLAFNSEEPLKYQARPILGLGLNKQIRPIPSRERVSLRIEESSRSELPLSLMVFLFRMPRRRAWILSTHKIEN